MAYSPKGVGARPVVVISIAIISLGVSAFAMLMAYWVSLPSPSYFDYGQELAALNQVRTDLYEYIFQIFVTAVTIISAISAILGVGIYSFIRAKIERRVAGVLDQAVVVAQRKTQAWAFNEFAFVWSELFEPKLQMKLREEQLDQREERELKDYIVSALRSARLGLEVLGSELDQDHFEDDASRTTQKVRVHLNNQLLYSETAKLIVTGTSESAEYISDLVDRADALWDLTIDPDLARLKFDWWLAIETIGFFKIYFGKIMRDKALSDSGRKIISDFINGKRPKHYLEPISDAYRNSIREEYRNNGIELEL